MKRKREPPIIDRKAGRKGMFTREIEKELLVGRIDVAVHSAKDLPSEQPNELEVRATLPRASTEDLLITKENCRPNESPAPERRLPPAAFGDNDNSLAASRSTNRRSARQRADPSAQIARDRRLGGNHPGPRRAGAARAEAEQARFLPEENFVPAGGQGMIALQVRRGDERCRDCWRG